MQTVFNFKRTYNSLIKNKLSTHIRKSKESSNQWNIKIICNDIEAWELMKQNLITCSEILPRFLLFSFLLFPFSPEAGHKPQQARARQPHFLRRLHKLSHFSFSFLKWTASWSQLFIRRVTFKEVRRWFSSSAVASHKC